MNIIRITPGLGKQMFQYAFYLAMKAQNKGTGIDLSEFMYGKRVNGYELGNIFTVTPNIVAPEDVKKYADVSKSFWAVMRRNVLRIRKSVLGTEYREVSPEYDSSVFTRENTYFSGVWQSPRYFEAVEDEVRKQFVFKSEFSRMNKVVAEAMAGCESVSIHIRRGNNTKKKRWREIGSICTLDYYNWAIANIYQQIGRDVHFFIFSDDMKWARENIKLDNATYVDWNTGKESYNDMRLMTMCKHNIIANSSFSWWAAFLNTNPDKVVIAPARWYRSVATPDIYPHYWVQIPIDNIK